MKYNFSDKPNVMVRKVSKKKTSRLKRIIEKLPKDGKDNKTLLREGLKELGWTEEKIKEFSGLKSQESIDKGLGKKTSPSFKHSKISKLNPKPFQGGSPGLGKKK